MLGSPRTGSTWLVNLLRVHPHVVKVDEPAIGSHLGLFAADIMGTHPAGFEQSEKMITDARRDDEHYFFCEQASASWRPDLRRLFLHRFAAYGGGRGRILVIKEPAGSQAAGMILSLLPKSRLLFLMRDGRDVIDSEVHAVQKGGWLAEQFGSSHEMLADERFMFVGGQAHRWVARTEAVSRAYEQHDPRLRMLVRYEDLLADTASGLTAILDWLGLAVDQTRIEEIVAQTAFDALPAEAKGERRFARAATPGLWRTNLTAQEQTLMNDVMGPTLEKFGYESGS